MGFFKNLFSGNFKEIARQAVKNISHGQLIKGGGIIGNLINTGVNTVTGGALTKLKGLTGGGSGGASGGGGGGSGGSVGAPSGITPKSYIRPLPNQKVKTYQDHKDDDFGDVNVNSNTNYIPYIVGALVIFYFIKKR